MLACLLLPAAVLPGGDPYFLLRPRLDAADVVVRGSVRSVKDVKGVMAPDDRVADVEIAELWLGGNPANAPERLQVHQWYGPEPDARGQSNGVFFLSREATRDGAIYRLQVAADLSSLNHWRLGDFRQRVLEFVEVKQLRDPEEQLTATVAWLMEQIGDPISREGASFELERPALHRRLSEEQVLVLQELYCSKERFDLTAGHLTDILDEVAVDRDRFVRCAFELLQGQVERATWIEHGLVDVIEASLSSEEVSALAQEYRETKPVAHMRGVEDSPDRRTARTDVLRRLCAVVQQELDAPESKEGAAAEGG